MSFALKRSLYVLNGFIGFLFLGCCYTWSIFVVPLETLFHYTRVETSLAFTLCIAGFSAGTLLTGILAKRIAYKTIIKLSALMVGCGFFFSGLSHTIIRLYLSYSILSGIGMGLGYASLISVIPLWFPEKIGTVTGILVMGYALSAALFAPLINRLI
ncbi:MAG: MFS transporter, partial [bacterium]